MEISSGSHEIFWMFFLPLSLLCMDVKTKEKCFGKKQIQIFSI